MNRGKTRDAQRGGIHGDGREAAAVSHREVCRLHLVPEAGDFGPEVFVSAGHEWNVIFFKPLISLMTLIEEKSETETLFKSVSSVKSVVKFLLQPLDFSQPPTMRAHSLRARALNSNCAAVNSLRSLAMQTTATPYLIGLRSRRERPTFGKEITSIS